MLQVSKPDLGPRPGTSRLLNPFAALSRPLPAPILPPPIDFPSLFSLVHSRPIVPSKWNTTYVEEIVARGRKRIEVLNERLSGITRGRAMPDLDQVTIGSGRRFERLAVLFLDICAFSSRKNYTEEEQRRVLAVMNIFMAEMINIVRDFGGTFEKNTGDGLMAYFGEVAQSYSESVRPAVEAALVMHYVNDNFMTPWFPQGLGIDPIRFRVGIDVGPVTIARVGTAGENNSIVAVGTPANIACKLMSLIPDGGVAIGNDVYRALPTNWETTCSPCENNSGFVYTADNRPYLGWQLNHRLEAPSLLS